MLGKFFWTLNYSAVVEGAVAVFYTDTVDLGGHDFYFYYQMIVQGRLLKFANGICSL